VHHFAPFAIPPEQNDIKKSLDFAIEQSGNELPRGKTTGYLYYELNYTPTPALPLEGGGLGGGTPPSSRGRVRGGCDCNWYNKVTLG
jgi:hypothetical protein